MICFNIKSESYMIYFILFSEFTTYSVSNYLEAGTDLEKNLGWGGGGGGSNRKI